MAALEMDRYGERHEGLGERRIQGPRLWGSKANQTIVSLTYRTILLLVPIPTPVSVHIPVDTYAADVSIDVLLV